MQPEESNKPLAVTVLYLRATSSTPRCSVRYYKMSPRQYDILVKEFDKNCNSDVEFWLDRGFINRDLIGCEIRICEEQETTIHLQGKEWEHTEDQPMLEIIRGVYNSTRVILWDTLSGMSEFDISTDEGIGTLIHTLHARWNDQAECGFVTNRLACIRVICESTERAIEPIIQNTNDTLTKDVWMDTIRDIVAHHPGAYMFSTSQQNAIAEDIYQHRIQGWPALENSYKRNAYVRLTDIDWDVDDDEDLADLPTAIESFCVSVPYNLAAYTEEFADLVVAAMSDVYGFCVNSYTYNPVVYNKPYTENNFG